MYGYAVNQAKHFPRMELEGCDSVWSLPLASIDTDCFKYRR